MEISIIFLRGFSSTFTTRKIETEMKILSLLQIDVLLFHAGVLIEFSGCRKDFIGVMKVNESENLKTIKAV